MANAAYDIVLSNDDITLGLMLATEEGIKVWSVDEAPTFSPRMSMESANYAQFPPEQEIVFAVDDWRDGFGQYKYGSPSRYYNATNVDCRYRGQAILGPAITATGDSGAVAIGEAKHPNAFAEFSDDLYLIATDATDVDVWKWDSANNYWTSVKTIASVTTPDGLCAFESWLVAACGSGYWYSTDGASFTEVTTLNVRKGLCVVGQTLWGAEPYKVKSCTDPEASGNWTSATTIGDAENNITALLNLDDVLYVGKEDGLFSFDVTTVINLLGEYRFLRDANNFRAMTAFHNEGYMSVAKDGLIHYSEGTVIDISVALYGQDVAWLQKRIASLAQDDQWLYAVMAPAAQAGNAYIMAGRWQASGDSTVWVWHPIARFTTANSAAANVTASFVTDAAGGNPRLWMGESGTTVGKPGYIILPEGHRNPVDDTSYRFATTGTMSLSWYDAGFVAIDKAFIKVVVQAEDVTDDVYLVVSYKADYDADWTYLSNPVSRVITEGYTTLYFPDNTIGKRIRIGIDFVTNVNTATPVLKSIAIHSALRPPRKNIFNFSIVCADDVALRNGGTDRQGAKTIASNLRALRDSVAPITLTDVDGVEYTVQLMPPLRERFISNEEGRAYERRFDITAMEVSAS